MARATVTPGVMVRITPKGQMAADTEANLGTIRSVSGTGRAAWYEVDATDRTGRRSTVYLARTDFTVYRPAGAR